MPEGYLGKISVRQKKVGYQLRTDTTSVVHSVALFPRTIRCKKYDCATGTVQVQVPVPDVWLTVAKCKMATNNTWNINPMLRDIEVPMEKPQL